MSTMKAIRMHTYGSSEVLVYEEIPRPETAADELLVRVFAAGVNPVDWKIRDGYLQEMMEVSLPLTLGWDVAGIVEETGTKAGPFQRGDKVYGYLSIPRNGSYSEYVVLKTEETAFMPESLDFIQAAAIPLAALTAWQSLFDAANLSAGQRVLIHGAAGGVGHFAVQLGRWIGAHVIATASTRNHDFLKSLGTHEIIDYTENPFEKEAEMVDLVFDTIGGDTWERSLSIINKGGMLVSILHPPPPPDVEANLGIKGAFVFVQPSGKQLGEIAALVDSNHLKPHVEKVLPLAQAAQAQKISESGHVRGKIVLRVSNG